MNADYNVFGRGDLCYLVLEVAYTQHEKEVKKKVGKWLEHPGVQGVVVLYINEVPPFRGDRLPPPPSDYQKMTYDAWMDLAAIETSGPISSGPISCLDITWVNVHEMEVEIFPREGESIREVSTLSGSLVIFIKAHFLQPLLSTRTNLPALNQAITKIWRNTVAQVYPETDVATFTLDWRVVCQNLVDALPENGWARYSEWCAKRRRSDDDDAQEGPSSEPAKRLRK